MNPPGVALSILAVVLAWLAGPTANGAPACVGGGPRLVRISPLAPMLTAAMVWGGAAVMADPLAHRLSVTAPTVRVAAGVGLLIASLGRTWSAGRCAAVTPADPSPPEALPGVTDPTPTSKDARVMIEAMVRGPVRVEVGMAVWSLSLDHGTATGLLVVGALSALSALSVLSALSALSVGSALSAGSTVWGRRGQRTIWAPGRAAPGVAAAAVGAMLTLNGLLGL